MSDYFIAPIQRIPRYCLLIKGIYILLLLVYIFFLFFLLKNPGSSYTCIDLQKYTHPSEASYTDLDIALKTLTGLAVAMNHVQNKNNIRTSLRTL